MRCGGYYINVQGLYSMTYNAYYFFLDIFACKAKYSTQFAWTCCNVLAISSILCMHACTDDYCTLQCIRGCLHDTEPFIHTHKEVGLREWDV